MIAMGEAKIPCIGIYMSTNGTNYFGVQYETSVSSVEYTVPVNLEDIVSYSVALAGGLFAPGKASISSQTDDLTTITIMYNDTQSSSNEKCSVQ